MSFYTLEICFDYLLVALSQALKRPGRLGAEIFVGLPSDETRREIFRVSFRRMPVDEDVVLDELVSRTTGYTGAEVDFHF